MSELVKKSRTYRRFYENQSVSTENLRKLVDLARLSPTAGNKQPLKFMLSNTPERNAKIFPSLAWAGYLKEWAGPAEGERPAAYIIILGDKQVSANFGVDHGIAAQSIMLGAVERGLGGCMIGSVNRPKLAAELGIAERYEILLALALGKPKETVVIEPVGAEGDIKYRRDEKGGHHVPKRSLDELIVK